MKCPGCGAEVTDGAKTCHQCGRDLSLGTRSVGETEHVAKATGSAIEKGAKGAWSGAKGLVSKKKKDEPKGDEAADQKT